MIARPNEPFEALLLGASPGLAGAMRVEVYDPTDGAQILAPTTAGVTEPRAGTYRASLTVATPGSFVIRWSLPDPGNVGAFLADGEEELAVSTSPPSTAGTGISPSIDDVGALLRARTKIPNGEEIGTFRDAPAPPTRPTASQVQLLIDDAVDEVTGKIGTPAADTPLEARARRAAALYAAILVELSFFPEQVASGRSPAETYRLLYKERIASLVAYVEQGGDDPDNTDGGAGAAEADLSFETQWVDGDGVLRGQPIVGFGTEW